MVPEDLEDIFYVLNKAGPSCLHVRCSYFAHIHLFSSQGVVILLASGKVCREASIFLAGGTFTAFNMLKDIVAHQMLDEYM